jgi:uncharacterized membrane protein YqjE
LFGLAALTKQPAVFTFAAMVVWQVAEDRRRALALVCGFLVTVTTIGAVWKPHVRLDIQEILLQPDQGIFPTPAAPCAND